MEEDKDIKNLENDGKINEDEINIFNNKLHSIQKGINTLKTKFGSLLETILKDEYELEYGLSFFESKQDMMLIYISNLLKYCLNKIKGNKIEDLQILDDNIKISSLIERIKVIEMKLQHLINRTINKNDQKQNNEQKINEADLKPKILSISNKNEEDDNIEEEEDNKKIKKMSKIYMNKDEIYKVKNKNIDFYEKKEDKIKRRRQLNRDKEKIRNSEMMRNLREEMSENPVNIDNNSNSYLNRYMKEVEEYENEHLVRVTVPKKMIKQLKKKDNNVDDLYKIDTNLKLISNVLDDKNNSKNTNIKSKKYLQKKRKHK